MCQPLADTELTQGGGNGARGAGTRMLGRVAVALGREAAYMPFASNSPQSQPLQTKPPPAT